MQLAGALVEERPSWYQPPKVRFITLTFGGVVPVWVLFD